LSLLDLSLLDLLRFLRRLLPWRALLSPELSADLRPRCDRFLPDRDRLELPERPSESDFELSERPEPERARLGLLPLFSPDERRFRPRRLPPDPERDPRLLLDLRSGFDPTPSQPKSTCNNERCLRGSACFGFSVAGVGGGAGVAGSTPVTAGASTVTGCVVLSNSSLGSGFSATIL
jgi:hypothetical protein